MNTPIELCNTDINKATFKNVMFFALAEAGAMGEPGGVLYYVKSGELYHFNYVYGDVEIPKVEKMFPALSECHFGIFGMDSVVPEGWKYVSLGMGNHLIMRETVYEKFISEFPKDASASEIYVQWLEVAQKIINLL